MRTFLAAALLAAAALAGCAADGPASRDGSEPSRADYDAIEAAIGEPFGDDGWVEGSADAHNLVRTATVTGEAGRAPLPTEGYAETAVKGGYAYLCRTGPQQGLAIFDLADVERPVQVGFLALHAGFEADVEVSDDGRWAFWETQRAYLSTPPVPPAVDPGANAPHGIHVVDVSDKAHPAWVSFTPILPDGPHSITYANVSGRHIVFASTYAFAYAYGQIAPPGTQRLVILELDTSGPTPRLVTLAEYADPGAREENVYPASGERFPHDVSVQVHPLTGRTYAYVAYWDLGVVILDVTDPANPAKVGQADDFGPAPYGDIHMARPFPGLIGGRHVTVAEPEISGAPDSGYLTFFDTTDPAEPVYLSSWKMPGHSASGASGGPHYFDAAHGRVALSHYAGGFWVVDVHDEENLLHPRTVAYAKPSAGSAFDAWWADATHMLVSESGAGMTVFRYEGPAPEQA